MPSHPSGDDGRYRGADHLPFHAADPDATDARADVRDLDAAARDQLADERDHEVDLSESDRIRLDRLLASRDRAAAALDRKEAALDRQRAEEYRRSAYRDGLTGVLQRDAGRSQLAQEVSRARRTETPLIVAFLDLDGLKAINDTFGHATGDFVLKSTGRALLAGLRDYDVVVRYGGDEFVCALPGSTLEEASGRFADVGSLLATYTRNRTELASSTISFSLGLALLNCSETLEDALERADRALYDGRRSRQPTV